MSDEVIVLDDGSLTGPVGEISALVNHCGRRGVTFKVSREFNDNGVEISIAVPHIPAPGMLPSYGSQRTGKEAEQIAEMVRVAVAEYRLQRRADSPDESK